MSTIDWMTPQQLQDLRDAGRGHLIDGAGPLLDKADELRKRAREEPAHHTPQAHSSLSTDTGEKANG